MGMLKPWHIIVLVAVVLLVFGAQRLPDLARSVGQSLKIFKSEVKELTGESEQAPATVPAGVAEPAPVVTSQA
ncbi:Sec-independent protein translocase subunit TatA [Luteimicrobium sp. DT211]|uniref:Sec-independent protein translocase subunit TatA n=1 Tax=Luteimicrobium sp. DT211 TaxID=3393412 RepID=UPI003CF3820A